MHVFAMESPVAEESTETETVQTQTEETASEIDWSRLDWGSEITLLSDLEDYYRQQEEFQIKGEYEKIKTMQKKKHPMTSDAVLGYYNVPGGVQKIVKEYRENTAKSTTGEIDIEGLKKSLYDWQYGSGEKSVEKLVPGENQKILFSEEDGTSELVDIEKGVSIPKALKKNTPAVQANIIENTEKSSLLPKNVQAEIISQEEVSETERAEQILYAISLMQEEDGSFGSFEESFLTWELLSKIEKTNNLPFTSLEAYLTNFDAKSNKEWARKIIFDYRKGSDVQAALDSLLEQQNTDYGFGIFEGYQSDLETSLLILGMLSELGLGDLEGGTATLEYKSLMYYVSSEINAYLSDPAFEKIYLVNRILELYRPFTGKILQTDGEELVNVDNDVALLFSFLQNKLDTENNDFGSINGEKEQLYTYYNYVLYDKKAELSIDYFDRVGEFQSVPGDFFHSVLYSLRGFEIFKRARLDIQSVVFDKAEYNNGDSVVATLEVKNTGYDKSELMDIHLFVNEFLIGSVHFDTSIDLGTSVSFNVTLDETRYYLGKTEFSYFVETANERADDNNWHLTDVDFGEHPDRLPVLPFLKSLLKRAYIYEDGTKEASLLLEFDEIVADQNKGNYALYFRMKGEEDWYAFYTPTGHDLSSLLGPFEEGLHEFGLGVLDRAGNFLTDNKIYELYLIDEEESANIDLSGFITLDNRLPDYSLNSKCNLKNSDTFDGSFSCLSEANGFRYLSISENRAFQMKSFKTPVYAPPGQNQDNIRIFTHLLEDDTPPEINEIRLFPPNELNQVQNNQTLQIDLNAQDLVGIQYIDLYYYDPLEGYWQFLMSEDYTVVPEKEIVRTFDWYIDDSFLGEGYKFKAIVRDFRGNTSSLESLEYEIIAREEVLDTTAPSIDEFYLTYYYPDRKFKTGKQYTFTVKTAENPGIYFADFSIYNPNMDEWVLIGEHITGFDNGVYRMFDWIIPDNYLGLGFKAKTVLYDDAGNVSETVEYGPFEIVEGSAPEFIFRSPQRGDVYELGTSMNISWDTQSVGDVGRVSIYVDYLDTGITDEKIISIDNTGSFVWDIPLDYAFVGENIQIHIEGEDSDTRKNGISSSETFSIIDSSEPSEPWLGPAEALFTYDIELEGGYESVRSAGVFIDDNKNIHALYLYTKDIVQTSNRQMTQQIIERVKQNNSWSDPVVIYEQVDEVALNFEGFYKIDDIKIKKDNTSNPHIVWTLKGNEATFCNMNYHDIYYLYHDGSSWSVAENISNNGSASDFPDFDIDMNGNVHFVWRDGQIFDNSCNTSDTKKIYYRKKNNTGIWENIQVLAFDFFDNIAKIAATDDGVLHLLYRSEQNNDQYSIYSSILEEDSWSNAELVFNFGSERIYELQLNKGINSELLLLLEHDYYDQILSHQTEGLLFTKRNNLWTRVGDFSPKLQNYNMTSPLGSFIDDNNYLHVFFEEDLFLNSQKKNVVWRVQNIDGNWEERIQANLDTQLVNAYGMDISEDKVNIAIIWDGSKDKEENVFVIEADMSKISLPPPSVDSLDIKKQNSLAEISWDSYPYDDFDHFNVYRSYSDKSKITELTPVASLSDKNATVYRDVLNTSSTLYYTVSVVDTDGNESEVSRWVSAEGEKQKNIVRDGFMEDPLYKWREWGKPAQAKKMFNKAYSGQTSFYINATEGHAGMQQANIPVEAGKKYRYSFRYKIEAGELQTVLAVGNPNGDFENKRKNLRNIDTEWSLYEREFYIPKDFDDNFIVRISSLFGSAHIDDIRIEEIVDFTRVKNGDFEKMGLGDFRGWGPNTDWKQVTTTVKSGYNALEIGGETGAGGIVQTGLLLEPGKKYKLEFDYKVDSGDFYYVLADNNANSDFERKYFTSTSTDGWVKEERYFRVRDSFTGSFNLRMSTGGGKTFVDNISIFELPGDDLNFDGNFEHEDLRFWRVWGSKNPIDFSKITTSTPVASSTHVMKIDGTLHGGTGMVQDLLQIELDKEYKVSFYAKVDSGDFRIALGNDDANVDTNGTWRIFKTRGKWKYVERVYTGEDFSSGYGTLRFSNRGGIAYVDDVRIEEIIE